MESRFPSLKDIYFRVKNFNLSTYKKENCIINTLYRVDCCYDGGCKFFRKNSGLDCLDNKRCHISTNSPSDKEAILKYILKRIPSVLLEEKED